MIVRLALLGRKMTMGENGRYVLYTDYSKHIRKCIELIDNALPSGEVRKMAIVELNRAGIDHGLEE